MKRLTNLTWLVFGLLMGGSAVFKIVKRIRTNNIPKSHLVHTKAIIIDDKNVEPNDPVKPEFTYSYSFQINGEEYLGNSQDKTLKVGDSIEIVYDKYHPQLNKPLNPKE